MGILSALFDTFIGSEHREDRSEKSRKDDGDYTEYRTIHGTKTHRRPDRSDVDAPSWYGRD